MATRQDLWEAYQRDLAALRIEQKRQLAELRANIMPQRQALFEEYERQLAEQIREAKNAND